MKDKLVTRGYCLILAANFLLYFAFYLILPVLPFYLTEVFHTGSAAIGIILSCYTVAALCIRPFSGYLLDSLARKPLYLLAYFVFIAVLAGYIWAGILSIFIMLRIVHGLAFGMVTVAGNTIFVKNLLAQERSLLVKWKNEERLAIEADAKKIFVYWQHKQIASALKNLI